jgi:predicted ATPase
VEQGDGDLRRKLLDIVQGMVPGFEDWETEQLADGRIAFKVREKGLRGTLPSLLASDGTIRLLTILAALFCSQLLPSTIFIEEPERSLHPTVMGQLVDLMREVSSQTQIIITTHSADFVRHCRPREIYLLDKVDGCTQVVQASSIEQIDEFLKQFTLDQLWLQGHLELGIP